MEEETKEVIQEKPNEKSRQIIQIVFLILLAIALAAIIGTTITIIRYGKMLQNPVGYNIEKFGINYCTCYDNQSRIIPIKSIHYSNISDKFIPKPEYIYPQLNITIPGR